MSWVITNGTDYYTGDTPIINNLSNAYKFRCPETAQNQLRSLNNFAATNWDGFTVAKLAEDTKDSGHDNPAYNLPEGVTNIYQLVTQSRMTDDVGECFRLLYTYATDGKYTIPQGVHDITSMTSILCFSEFMYNAMQALYRSGTGSRNSLERDMEKAQYYIHQEWKRVERQGSYNELLEAAQDLMTDIVGKPYVD